ncbi:MAG: hypothetical protein A2Z05_02040 [Chloroflexi bacterium RBG_16_60_22]|nr:MAG: hypothetical protein A2Z05_02040 [Chloroflexi bacterium RBG_16_60_22]
MIKERTNGRVQITWYWNASLSSFGDTFRSVQSGVADGSLYVFGINPGVHQLNLMYQMPFTGWSGVRGGSEVYDEMRKKFPELDKEFISKGVTPFFWAVPMGNYDLHIATKQQVRVPGDLKGMKVMVSPIFADVIKTVGGAQLYYGPPDWYMALERGLAEAHIVHWAATEEQRLYELFDHHTIMGPSGFSTNVIGVLMNLDTWNSLPPDLQGVITGVGKEMQEITIEGLLKQHEAGIAEAKKRNQAFIEITPAEVEQWRVWVKPVWDKWIADTEAKGWPNARQIFEEALRIAKLH